MKFDRLAAFIIRIPANLSDANLQGTNLTGANLREATLEHANLEGVIMPDGKLRED